MQHDELVLRVFVNSFGLGTLRQAIVGLSFSGLRWPPHEVGNGCHHDPPMHAVVTCSLSKSYGAHEALRGIDLRVPAGPLYGFPRPEGAGKPRAGSHCPNSLLTHQLILT
jgi:hypothetical protein